MNTVTPPLDEFRPVRFDPAATESLLVRWFVRFNPLFSLSALCVLGGVLLLSRALRDVDNFGGVVGIDGVVAVSVVVELYQWLAIGTAALLYRRLNEHRPGVILGLIALAFAIDPTLQLSGLAAAGHVGLSALWVVGIVLKVEALAAAFCLRLSTSARVLPAVSAALLALLPNLRLLVVDLDETNTLAVVFIVGVLGLAVVATLVPPTITSWRALDDDGQLAFARIRRAVVGIGLVGAVLQGGNAMFAMGADAVAPLLASLALVTILVVDRHRETVLWSGVVVAFIALIGAHFEQLGPALIGVALIVAGRPRRAQAFAPRVVVVGLVALAMQSVHLLNAFGADTPGFARHVVVVVALTVALVGVLITQRAWSALAALLYVHARTLGHVVAAAVDDVGARADAAGDAASSAAAFIGARGAGIGLVVVGFVLVPAGVLLHRRLTANLSLTATSTSPASSAAPGI